MVRASLGSGSGAAGGGGGGAGVGGGGFDPHPHNPPTKINDNRYIRIITPQLRPWQPNPKRLKEQVKRAAAKGLATLKS